MRWRPLGPKSNSSVDQRRVTFFAHIARGVIVRSIHPQGELGENEHDSSPPGRDDIRTRPAPVDMSQVQAQSGAVVHPRRFAKAAQRRPPGGGVLRAVR